MKIFICHSSSEKPLVREIISYLPDGIRSWLDELEIVVGMDIRSEIRRAIDQADFLIAIISPTSIHSEWVRFEIEEAITKETQSDSPFLLPLCVNMEAKEIPDFINERNHLKLYDNSASQVKKVSNDIKDAVVYWSKVQDQFCKTLRRTELEIIAGKIGIQAATVSLILPRLLEEKFYSLIEFQITGDDKIVNIPDWLLEVMYFSLMHHRSQKPEHIVFAKNTKKIFDQVFLMSFYAALVGRGASRDKRLSELDASAVFEAFDTLKSGLSERNPDLIPSDLEIEIWDMCVSWVSVYLETEGQYFFDDKEVHDAFGEFLMAGVFLGFTVGRATCHILQIDRP